MASCGHEYKGGDGDFEFPELDLDQSSSVNIKSDAELENFLGRVDEITSVIQSLSSKDASEVERGLRQADILLHEKDVGDGDAVVTQDRTLINKVSSKKLEGDGQNNPQAFMAMMEKDAQERSANRKERKVISDQFRKKGNILFAKKDYAGALRNYNEAIKLIKDSPCLYNNRALTYIRLGIFSSAVEDAEKGLMLEEYSLRSRMFLAKATFLMGNADKCRQILQEARVKMPGSVQLINDYQRDLFNMSSEKPFDFDLESEKMWASAAAYEGTEHPVKSDMKMPKSDNLRKESSQDYKKAQNSDTSQDEKMMMGSGESPIS